MGESTSGDEPLEDGGALVAEAIGGARRLAQQPVRQRAQQRVRRRRLLRQTPHNYSYKLNYKYHFLTALFTGTSKPYGNKRTQEVSHKNEV